QQHPVGGGGEDAASAPRAAGGGRHGTLSSAPTLLSPIGSSRSGSRTRSSTDPPTDPGADPPVIARSPPSAASRWASSARAARAAGRPGRPGRGPPGDRAAAAWRREPPGLVGEGGARVVRAPRRGRVLDPHLDPAAGPFEVDEQLITARCARERAQPRGDDV